MARARTSRRQLGSLGKMRWPLRADKPFQETAYAGRQHVIVFDARMNCSYVRVATPPIDDRQDKPSNEGNSYASKKPRSCDRIWPFSQPTPLHSGVFCLGF